jgi:hypothetical protein
MSAKRKAKRKPPVLTAKVGRSSSVFKDILFLYASPGDVIADVTYGQGAFWEEIPEGRYRVVRSDLAKGDRIDFRTLPYDDDYCDALVLDPPWMQGGRRKTGDTNNTYSRYQNIPSNSFALARLYGGGLLEAARVLRPKGIIIIKCQDQVEGGKQRWTHIQLMLLLNMFGFEVEDLFVMVNPGSPMMRHKHQEHARKNHSYFIVGRLMR